MSDGAKYRLGLDLGTNSIGWAAVELDGDGNPRGLLDLGVRIFPDGRDARGEASNAVERRTARGQRRRRDRYLTRRERLMQALVDCGLMPADENARKKLESIDPYQLRARALDSPLQPYELGRALFHLNQRRGFKSNRKAAGGDENEDGKIRADIGGLRRRMAESGARTLGEFLARRHQRNRTVRARPGQELYPDRAMYEAEFDRIRAAQEPHHLLSAEQWDALRDVTFFQRRLHGQQVGKCQFEEGEPRAARALPAFQEFRMLQEVNNLRVRTGIEPERPLNDAERKYALQRLRGGSDINLAKPTGILKGLTFNLAAGGRKSIKGDETAANVSLPGGYGNLSEKAIGKILPHLRAGLRYSDAVLAAGYPHHSDFRNPEAHDSLPYYEVVLPRDAVGADPKRDAKRDGEPARYGRIANPTVHIGLNQLRRVVNGIIEVYGKPQEIVVELARELKWNREQKLNYQQRQREGAKRNKRFVEMLESAEQGDATPDMLRKLRLWEEQKYGAVKVCPYTGATISFEMVMSAQTEVDHILPFSRTLDNSMSNLVVCLADANRDKGNRTPYEAFSHNPPGYNYDAILSATADFPANKRWRFQEDAMARFEDEREFLDRQLNETQYLSRTARTYLAYLYDEQGAGQRVRVIPGRMTALLRRAWGLEGMLRESTDGETTRKQRDDHRHHAIDAFVVANTTQGLLQQFAQAAGSGYQDAEENLARFAPKPWEPWEESGRNEVKRKLDEIVVSHRPDHGTRGEPGQTTGQLHEATAYGVIEPAGDGRHKVVLRKDLSKFTAKDLDNVPDQALRNALRRLWNETGGKAADFAEHAAKDGVLVNGHRQQVRRVRIYSEQRVISIKDATGKPYKGYLPGGNEFADVWRLPDGSWRTVVVTTFDANRPDFNSDDSRPHPAAKRLMRLQINDMGALGEGEDRRIVRVRSTSVRAQKGRPDRISVCLDAHNEAQAKEREYSAKQLQEQGFRKVRVDELGRVYDRGPFKS